MHSFKFRTHCQWKNGLKGEGSLTNQHLECSTSVPQRFGGKGAGTNPEELILSAASSCYSITLAAILEKNGADNHLIRLRTEGTFTWSRQLQLTEITHHVSVSFPSKDQLPSTDQLQLYTKQAEQFCMVSEALKGNVKITAILGESHER